MSGREMPGDVAMLWAQPISIQQISIEPSALEGNAGVYGAGHLALSTVHNIQALNRTFATSLKSKRPRLLNRGPFLSYEDYVTIYSTGVPKNFYRL